MKVQFVRIGMMLSILPLMALSSAAIADNSTQAQQKQDQQQQIQKQDRAKLEQQLQSAREKLQAAAQQVAKLSMQLNGPDMERAMRMRFFRPNHAILGVTINDGDTAAGGAGVKITAVTPDGPAEKAGLRAGDVITSINGTHFNSRHDQSAAGQLVTFMDQIKPGDALKVTYTRNGKAATADIKAGRLDDGFAFAFGGPPMPPVPPAAPTPPTPPESPDFMWFMDRGQAWSGVQLVPLSHDLGRYFGTDKGLLVLRVPKHDTLKLRAGDVILKIGGRLPGSPPHAMRILRSYGPGENVQLSIMRDGKPETLNITLPAEKDDEGGSDISALYRRFHVGPSFLHFGLD